MNRLNNISRLSPVSALRGGGVSWSAFWASLSTATVEDANPDKVVLTFTKADTKLVASDFSISGFTVSSLGRDVTNKILTLTLSTEVVYENSLTVVLTKGGTHTHAVTNNVLYYMTLTSTGTGAGVATLAIQASSDCALSLSGNGKFYSDSGGTADESATWTITASNGSTLRTRYIKVASGTSRLKFANASLITKWGNNASVNGWVSSTNAPGLSHSNTAFANLTQLRLTGTSTLTNAMPSGLIYLFLSTGVTWSQSCSMPSGLTYLYLYGNTIAWTCTAALPTGLTTLHLDSTNISWTYNGALPTGLTYLAFTGAGVAWTYNGALPTGLTYCYLYSASVAWTYNGALPTGLTLLYLGGNSIDWTGLDIGNNGNIGTLTLANYRVSKMSSADMITLLTQMKNRTGTLPATVTINDYADYASPPAGVTTAVNDLKAAKSITTVNLGA